MRLPRYLYHFTSKTNLSKILKEGLYGSFNFWDDQVRGVNVYMVDMQNFAKNWSKDTGKGYNLQSCLIFGQALKGDCRDLCCLRITTDKLTSPVSIRSQKYLINKNSIKAGSEVVAKGEKYKLYQRNGHAIEYIHQGDIDPSAIELVGSATVSKNIDNIFECGAEKLNKEALKMLKTIFGKTKELKALE